MIWAESTLMVLPHQFSAREASTSRRVTLGCLPSLSLRNEKRPCSPEAKCVVWPFQSAHWSEVAQPAPDSASPTMASRLSLHMLVMLFSSRLCTAPWPLTRRRPCSLERPVRGHPFQSNEPTGYSDEPS